jgi:hypothetical protein
MKKCLFISAFLVVLHVGGLQAQGLFEAPDTVCVRQKIQLKSNVPSASTHFWGFCSAYGFNVVKGKKLDGHDELTNPAAIEIAQDGDKYYGFAVTRGTGVTPYSFIRYEFGRNLDGNPIATNFGAMDTVLPEKPNCLYIVHDTVDSTWHVFVAGGDNVSNSTLARLDFGKSLANTPNVVNFGNYNNELKYPVGLFIAKEGKKWFGHLINRTTTEMIRIEFDTNISFTPKLVNMGVTPGQNPNGVTDLAAIHVSGLWHYFVTNEANNSLNRYDMGSSLETAVPSLYPLNTLGGNVVKPSGITLLRDCDSIFGFITNRSNHSFIRFDLKSVTDPNPNSVTFGNPASALLAPVGLSSFIRQRDNIYAFTLNSDSSLAHFRVPQCNNATVQSSVDKMPPSYTYDTAGVYNVYYAINEGTPDMQVQCKLITVIPIPALTLHNDTTICQGDTISLYVISVNALSLTWSPNYNISNLDKPYVNVWPQYSLSYKIHIPYPKGCIVDTAIKITVREVNADAGPDRTLRDGASTILGGPFSSINPEFNYVWWPEQYINDFFSMNPVVKPPHDLTYYLKVTDTSGCSDIDTVVVHVECNDINLPNAFMPNGKAGMSRFGLKNAQIAKLNFFRIYDRWGALVFTAGEGDSGADITREWDGKINDKDAPFGVYVWQADGFCINGQRLQKSGNVTLIR